MRSFMASVRKPARLTRWRGYTSARHYQLLSNSEMNQLFVQKYGKPETSSWSPKQRYRFGYYLPADVYEAVISSLVFEGCSWLDVGGGHSIFPDNPALARSLVSRCANVVAVDPSDNVNRNEFAHERVQCFIDEYRGARQFDLVTLRMVVEHMSEPDRVVESLDRLMRPGGIAVILTVNLWSPITLISRSIPFRLHHAIKKVFWDGEEEDTFPVYYRMNSRQTLWRYFGKKNLKEVAFAHLDDLTAFGKFKVLNYAELLLWKILKLFGINYPENCLLGIYEKSSAESRKESSR